jgi:hypothetical protein
MRLGKLSHHLTRFPSLPDQGPRLEGPEVERRQIQETPRLLIGIEVNLESAT